MITRQTLRLLLVSLLFGGLIHVASKLSLGADRPQGHRPERSSADRKSALLAQFNLDNLSLDREDIHAGGPGKDGIPSLNRPKTLPVAKAEYPADARVGVVTVGKKTRGYPLAILTWHEAINDVLGDVPIAVIYCPLCDSVSVVDRRLGQTIIEFGISGLLHNSNVLLFDRKTDALWSQLGLQAVSGPHVGKSLTHLPWRITTFAKFRKESPDADIVGRETGHQRDYDRNPYAAYFRTDRLMFPVTRRDVRLKAKTPVVGVKIGDIARAYPVEAIRQADGGQVIDRLGSAEIVLKADKDTVSIVEVSEGASVVHTFWFAWAAFHPDTGVYGQEPTSQEASITAPDTLPDDQRRDSTE